ncbi:MAG: thioredoxin family protein, partial [Phycisphaerae bacterium]
FIATRLRLAPSAGITFGTPRYPQHKVIDAPGLTKSGRLAAYDQEITILVPVTIAADAAPGPRTFNLTVHSQACDDKRCQLPSDLPVAVAVTIAAAGSVSQPAHAEIFRAAQAQTFLELPVAPPATDQKPAATAASAPAGGTGGAEDKDDLAIIQQRQYRPANTGESAAATYPLWQLILFALAGGAILNVMPCVLPVIPLKVLALVQQAHGDRRQAIVHSLVFSAGIVTLFVVLAGVFGVLRGVGEGGGAGGAVIYGQTYQSPVFLMAMSCIVLALALSMLGVWTINPPQIIYDVSTSHSGYLGSFSMGLLATLLATPCSAPLLGPVLAWAFVQPLLTMGVMFAFVGIGMAIPYVLLAAFPVGIDKLPRAGRWTELLKEFLGLVMIGVALYLLFQLSAKIWPGAFVGALIVASACWGWGRIPTGAMEPVRVWKIRGVVVLLGLLAGYGIYHFYRPRPAALEWQPFSVAALDEALAQKRPVVVDFTASWCLNCRVVESVVLESDEVQKAFQQSHALLLRGDITESNPVVQTLLAKLDAHSIPVLAIFTPEAPLTPAVLRDIYSKDRVISELHTR